MLLLEWALLAAVGVATLLFIIQQVNYGLLQLMLHFSTVILQHPNSWKWYLRDGNADYTDLIITQYIQVTLLYLISKHKYYISF